jgi:RNA polymerase sigma factor (sigma-70 family)
LNGNHQAEEIFFKKYQKIVGDYLKHKLPPIKIGGYEIDDCVQMILIHIFENLKMYDLKKSNVKTWVLVIAKHFMIDRWRNTNACATTILPAISTNINLTSCDYTSSYFGGTVNAVGNSCVTVNNCCSYSSSCTFENNNAISYISSQLSPTDFTLLDMKYVQGYDYKEIGSEFQLTSSTVSNKINYIKTKLKKSLPAEIFE